jgi:hypothetical protein
MRRAGLEDLDLWSVAVPVSNLLYGLGNLMIRRSGQERMASKPLKEQTESSGVREIPFKTVFPSMFRFFLNGITLYPFFLLQRLFYRSDLGLVLMGIGRTKKE